MKLQVSVRSKVVALKFERERAMKNSFAKNILWAVDPFHENPKQQLKMGKTLPLLFGANANLIPVSVLHRGRYNPEQQVFLETWNELASAAKKNLNRLLLSSKIPNLQPPQVIAQEDSSIGKAVTSLIAFALEEKVDAIAVSSHGRKGVARILLGSFAETLVLHSPIPVLVINPAWAPHKKIKHIIFPTDFSEASKLAYTRTLRLARTIGCKVLLFHKTQFAPVTFGLVVPPMGKKATQEVLKILYKKGESWAKMGQILGVDVKFYLADQPGYALEDILKAAKRHPSTAMIAMASQSGSVESVILGSLTRQVLRNASCPVLTIHPEQRKVTEKVAERFRRAGFEYSAHPLVS